MPQPGRTREPGPGGVRRSWLREPLTWMGFAILAVLIGGTTLSTGTTAFFTFTSWVNANVFQSGTVSLVASRTSTTELAVDRLLPGDILTKLDRMSMAVSLEARVPLLDHPLVEFACGLPAGLRMRGAEAKYLLKRVLRGRVPDAVLTRPKQGFGVPLELWF